jgi:hypothetical protein
VQVLGEPAATYCLVSLADSLHLPCFRVVILSPLIAKLGPMFSKTFVRAIAAGWFVFQIVLVTDIAMRLTRTLF